MLTYSTEAAVTPGQFRDLLVRSTLAERRPVDDPVALRGMVENASLMVSCWVGPTLVGIARSMTDFHFCCYLSCLAVDRDYQRQGVGKALIARTQQQLGRQCSIILLAAPAAEHYYARIGFEERPGAWILRPDQSIT